MNESISYRRKCLIKCDYIWRTWPKCHVCTVIYKKTQFCQPNANGLQNVSTCQLGNCIYQARNKSCSAKMVTQHITIKKNKKNKYNYMATKGAKGERLANCVRMCNLANDPIRTMAKAKAFTADLFSFLFYFSCSCGWQDTPECHSLDSNTARTLDTQWQKVQGRGSDTRLLKITFSNHNNFASDGMNLNEMELCLSLSPSLHFLLAHSHGKLSLRTLS